MERCAFRNLCKQPGKEGNLRSAVISALRGLLACPTGMYTGYACEKRGCAPFDAIYRFFMGFSRRFCRSLRHERALRVIVCTAPAGVRLRKMSAIVRRDRDPADDGTK